MDQKKNQNDEIEINLQELFYVLWNNALVIVLVAVLCASIAFAYTKFLVTPMYKSTTSIYVLNRQNESTVTSSDLSASTQLTYDYSQLIKSRTVAEEVIKRLRLNLDADKLIKRITTSTPNNSRIINISVLDEDPATAKRIADSVRNEAAIKIQEVTACDAVNMVDEANLPTAKDSPSYFKNVAIGGLFGGALAVGTVVLKYILDDTIKTAEDVEKYLGLSTLGSIPEKEKTTVKKKKNKTKKVAKR